MLDKNDYDLRISQGIKSGIVGLITNLLLGLMKVFAGLRVGSVSILADAINSFGDTASAFLTIAGFYIANKPADSEHPYGHQRAEYISGLIMAILIMIVGFEFFMTSLDKIKTPTLVGSSRSVFLILIVSIMIKLILALYYQRLNKNIQSQSVILITLIKDSLNDALMTVVIIVSYFIEIRFGWQLDGYIGLIVAIFIIYSGITSIVDVSDNLLGRRPDQKLVREMQKLLDSYDDILGYHDLLIHKYGPSNYFVTVDIEMDANWTLLEAHEVIDKIEEEFKERFNSVTVCHLDPIVLDNQFYNEIYHFIKKTLKNRDQAFHFHDFRVIDYNETKEIHFDLVIPEHITETDGELYQFLKKALAKDYGDYQLKLNYDHHYLLD